MSSENIAAPEFSEGVIAIFTALLTVHSDIQKEALHGFEDLQFQTTHEIMSTYAPPDLIEEYGLEELIKSKTLNLAHSFGQRVDETARISSRDISVAMLHYSILNAPEPGFTKDLKLVKPDPKTMKSLLDAHFANYPVINSTFEKTSETFEFSYDLPLPGPVDWRVKVYADRKHRDYGILAMTVSENERHWSLPVGSIFNRSLSSKYIESEEFQNDLNLTLRLWERTRDILAETSDP